MSERVRAIRSANCLSKLQGRSEDAGVLKKPNAQLPSYHSNRTWP